MSILQHWQQQKDALRSLLTEAMPSSEVVVHIRHALLQTEQNALAEMDDPLLRQQAAILMNCLKGSLGFLEAHKTGKTWVAQKSQAAVLAHHRWWRIAFAILAFSVIVCGLRDEWFIMLLSFSGMSTAAFALITERKKGFSSLPPDELRISVSVDFDRMLTVLDGQLRAADRYLEDFSYLNEQACGISDHADAAVISRAVQLMETLYDCSDEERAPVEEAARQLLLRLGLETVDYSEETSRLFNALPSKSITRTLSPAIVSAGEKTLLRRGTAAVRIDAA